MRQSRYAGICYFENVERKLGKPERIESPGSTARVAAMPVAALAALQE
jgi:hypothetical protein